MRETAERINMRINGLRQYLRLMNPTERANAEKLIYHLARTRAGIQEGKTK